MPKDTVTRWLNRLRRLALVFRRRPPIVMNRKHEARLQALKAEIDAVLKQPWRH